MSHSLLCTSSYAAEIYVVQELQLHGVSPIVHLPVPHLDQQVSTNRFFGQGLARFVSDIHMNRGKRLLPGAQVVMLGSL